MPKSASVMEQVGQGPVGVSVLRADGAEKVRGEPVYYGDIVLPSMLHGQVLRSRYPHARILSIDTARAKALPGVVVVATAADIPGVKTFGRTGDQPILSFDKVRFMGDAVALVAAETAEIADKALELIEVQYEELPAVFCPKEAMLPGAVRVHEGHDNVQRHFKLRKGNVDDAYLNKGAYASAEALIPKAGYHASGPYVIPKHPRRRIR